ncbi:abortive infection family protein [Candidatus Kaiserbacteria bacterium]|nr:abortive infection family protein [Candidatus Kaiserbacteria bacterium]
MKNIKLAIEENEKWTNLHSYIELIEQNCDSNQGVALDGAKSLLESISKTILADRGIVYAPDASLGRLVKDAVRSLPSFDILDKQDADVVVRIVSGLESVSSSIGSLRNRHGTVGHGKDLHEERELDRRLANLAISCVDNLAGFLMEAHSSEPDGIKRLRYEDFSGFNERFDEQQEQIEIEGIVISPSRALFDQDIEAFKETAIAFGQKEKLVDDLETSFNFVTTHNIIEGLSKHKDFSEAQVRRLVSICSTNNQVEWIIGDPDVHKFYSGILSNYRHYMPTEQAEYLFLLLNENKSEDLDF